MIKVVVIGGVPASGKTTLFRQFLERYQETPVVFESGLVNGSHYPIAKVSVLGDYTQKAGLFAGTDRFSMAAQPSFTQFVQRIARNQSWDGWTVMLEGDRLFNSKTLKLLEELQEDEACESLKIALKVTPEIQKKRIKQRGSDQTQSWLQGRTTKVAKLVQVFGLKEIAHNSSEDTLKLIELIDRFIIGAGN
jgi:hypothetical protein